MSTLSYDQVDILLVDPDRGSRDGIRNILHNSGFRGLRLGTTLADIREEFKEEMPDLLISDALLSDGTLGDLVAALRHHQVGTNPFLPVIATMWNPTPETVRKTVESGVDDLLIKPLSTSHLLNRIKTLVNARKPFVVTSDYIGPARRTRPEDSEEAKAPTVAVPNTLRAKITGEEDDIDIQHAIDRTIAKVNQQKLDSHSKQISVLAEAVVAAYERREVNDNLARNLDRLFYVAEDAGRRLVGTPYDHVSELCQSLIKVTGNIRQNRAKPESKDLQLLKPLSQAIRAAFHEDAETAAIARRISASVSGDLEETESL